MRGVVAVLHEHPRELPELQGDGHGSISTEAKDVLAALLPRRYTALGVPIPTAAREDLALFEVDVDRMIPVSTIVDQFPDLAGAQLGGRRKPAEVGVQILPVIRPDAPGVGVVAS